MSNNKDVYSYLFKNTFLFALSSLSTKVMSYLVLPLYTGSVSETEYGIIDLINVIVNLVVPIVSLCISDWLLRYVSEDKNNASKCFSISLSIIGVGFCLLLFICPIISNIGVINHYSYYIAFGFLLTTCNMVFSYTLRALDKVSIISISSILSSILTITINYAWRHFSSLTIDSYFVCQYVGILVGLIVFFFAGKLYKLIKPVKVHKSDFEEIRTFSLPLIPNSLFWWINSSIDKLCIITILSVSASGKYAAASKLPSLLTIFAAIFQQAWNLTVYKKAGKESSFEETTLKLYEIILALGAMTLILFTKPLASLLLKEDFYTGWDLVPILVVAFVFTTLSTFVGSFFTAAKNTKPLLYSSMISSLVNVLFNVVLIRKVGLQGAAIATMLSSMTNYYIRLFLSYKYGYIQSSINKFCILTFVLIIFVSLSYSFYDNPIIQIIISISVFVLLLIQSYPYLRWIISVLKK